MTNRATMAANLTLGPASPTKTFVLETHTDDPVGYLEDLAGPGNVEQTDDAFLRRAQVDDEVFWVDQLNPRFWSFHTTMKTSKASSIVNSWVSGRRDLDWVWLPSEHLRNMWPGAVAKQVRTDFRSKALNGSVGADTEDLRLQLSGRNAEVFLDYVSNSSFASAVAFDGVEAQISDPDYGWAREAVNRMGKFAVYGDSFVLHAQFVGAVVERYSRLVALCESKAIRWSSLDSQDGGGTVAGGPIALRFSRPIPDLLSFVDSLFSSRAPFRLWGVPEIGPNGVAEVEAVDLHVGQRLRFDIGERWLRIYLEAGACGNTVARLVSNLQHRFDAALTLVDTELQDAVGHHLAAPQRPAVQDLDTT